MTRAAIRIGGVGGIKMPTAEAPSTEFIQILVNLIRGDHKSAVYQLRSSHASADEFLRFAAANGLSVVVLRALENATLRAMFLPSAIELLEKRAQERADRSLRLLRELDRIAEIFAAAGQRFMLLKGPYLAKRFYGDSQDANTAIWICWCRRKNGRASFGCLRTPVTLDGRGYYWALVLPATSSTHSTSRATSP